MRVFGIDCGTDCTGYGVVEWSETGHAGSREACLMAVASGGIRLPKRDTMSQKLGFVYRELMLLLAAHHPEVVAIEEVFYSANVKSALKLGQVRGVALLAAANCGLPVAEYAPLKIKSSVVGYGLAQKEQVQFMVARLLRLECVPEPADAADALAVAICHMHTAQTLAGQLGGRALIGEWRRAWLVLAFALPFAGECRGQKAGPAPSEASPAVARVTFHYENPQLQPAKYDFTLDESGAGSFRSEPGAVPPPDSGSYRPLAEALERPVQLSPATAGRIFSTARGQRFFQVACEDTKDKVAFQGTKQLSYSGPEGSGSCTYNWSKLVEIQKVTATLEAIAYTLEEGRRLELEHKHDRLAVDAELEELITAAKEGRALELQTIQPTLQAIIDDEALLERARMRARKLLDGVETSRASWPPG